MEDLLKKYCKKYGKHKNVYYHEKSNLYMILSKDEASISVNTCMEWLFSFTEESVFTLFIKSLELNFPDE